MQQLFTDEAYGGTVRPRGLRRFLSMCNAVAVTSLACLRPAFGQADATGHHAWILGPTIDANGDGVQDYVVQAQLRGVDTWKVRISIRSGQSDDEIAFWEESGKPTTELPAYQMAPVERPSADSILIRQLRCVSAHALLTGTRRWDRSDWAEWKGIIGDVDGDGHDDAVLSVPKVKSDSFTDVLVSTLDGSAVKGPRMSEWSRSIPVGDVDGDGLVDAIRRFAAEPMVAVISGKTGRPTLSFQTGARFEQILSAWAGDVDHDGKCDLVLLGFMFGKTSPSLIATSGSDARTISNVQPVPALVISDETVIPVANRIQVVGDIDKDGVDEIATVMPESNADCMVDGAHGGYGVSVRSVRKHTQIWNRHRGWVMSLVAVPDRNNDGVRDLVLVDDGVHLTVLSGRDGENLGQRSIGER